MHPVSTHGAHKITMNSQERDYQQKLAQATAQADGNSYVTGINKPGNFQSPSSTANVPSTSPVDTSGSVELGTSGTEFPSNSPDEFQTEALDRRLGLIAKAASNADESLNNRSQTGSI